MQTETGCLLHDRDGNQRLQKRVEVYIMYIPEFWCGVGMTIIVEVVAIVIWAVIDTHKKKK